MYQGYEINGNTFYTVAQDKRSTNQNSSVHIDGTNSNRNIQTYYGRIEEIWELDYAPNFKVPLFRCQWVKLTGGGVTVDKEYEKLDACPVCHASRYKIRRDDPGDVEGERPTKKISAKIMWYAPIIPRLKHLFRNKEHAKLLRWHKEDRKVDNMLRHPADGS